MPRSVAQIRPQEKAATLLEPLFQRLSHYVDLSDADRDLLAELVDGVEAIEPGAQILMDEGPVAATFVAGEGWLFRYRTLSDGRRQIINTVLPGDTMNVGAAFFARSDHSIEALTASTIVRLSKWALAEILKQSPLLGGAICWTSGLEGAMLRERTVVLGRRSARERIAHLLLELQFRLSLASGRKSPAFDFPLTRVHLADMLGLSHVHVSRTISDLRRDGLIAYSTGRLHILERERLEEIADFSATHLHLDSVPCETQKALQSSGKKPNHIAG